MTKGILHQSDTRGLVDFGWLKSRHTFSFGKYHDPARMNFGSLRVLNDDEVAPAMGFGSHPHDNMEIISIPLEGTLEHKDSMGNTTIISKGEIQVMSAGTGIFHSEYNKNSSLPVKFLQIWITPNQRDVIPRYDQKIIDQAKIKNQLGLILSPSPQEHTVWINQNAWFSMGSFDEGLSTNYQLKEENNGIYIFLIEGQAAIEEFEIDRRDGLGLVGYENLSISFKKASQILIMEIPL